MNKYQTIIRNALKAMAQEVDAEISANTDKDGLRVNGDMPKCGDYFIYTNSSALGLVRFVGLNPNTGGIVVTNECAPDKHLRTIAGWEHLTPTQPPKREKA